MSLESTVLKFSADQLEQLCSRIETCLDKLTPEQIWARGGDHANAAGNLALHLTGNVRQWILHGAAGQPDVRKRDLEFETRGGIDPSELKRHLRSTVEEAAAVIRALPSERLCEHVTIQKYDVTVIEAVLHVVEHFSQHTGQVIFIAKFLTGEDLGFYAHLRSAKAHGEKTP